MTPLLRSCNITIQSYYHSIIHTAIKIKTALNKVISDKLQLNLILILTVPQIKLIMNLHQCIAYWYSFVISPNNTPCFFGSQFICEICKLPHFGTVF